MTVAGNIGSAMEMASTGLVVLGAAVPLNMLKGMGETVSSTTRRKRKKKSKRSRK